MSKTVTVGTEEFELPIQGENADYAEELTDFFVAVADSLATVQQPNDVLRTSAPINNGVTSPAAIPGFSFDTSEVRSINAEFIITRTGDSPSVNLVESGFIKGNYDGTDWSVVISSTPNGTQFSGVTLDITSSGQITYISSNISTTNYSGAILFRAKVFNEDT